MQYKNNNKVLPKGILATRANSLGPPQESMVVKPAGAVVGVEKEAVKEEKEVSLTNAEELCNEAVALHAAGDVGEAIILYRRALEMTKVIDGHACRDPTILFNLGAALQASGDTDGAVGCFATILDAIDPNDTHARVQVSITHTCMFFICFFFALALLLTFSQLK
jgi:tetratricopeptide (TPR) repeat protein